MDYLPFFLKTIGNIFMMTVVFSPILKGLTLCSKSPDNHLNWSNCVAASFAAALVLELLIHPA